MLIVVGLLTVPRLIRFVVRLDRPETTVVASVGLAFGFALLADWFGYSVALGAFLAGAWWPNRASKRRSSTSCNRCAISSPPSSSSRSAC